MGVLIYSGMQDSSRYVYLPQVSTEKHPRVVRTPDLFLSPTITTFITFNEFLKLYEAVFSWPSVFSSRFLQKSSIFV